MKTITRIAGGCLMILCGIGTAAGQILTANFDTLHEGSLGNSFSYGGISFYGLDERIPDTPGGTFTIEATTASLPGFSPPDYLTTEGYVPGNGYSFGRFGSANIGFTGTGSFASLNVFGFNTTSMNTLTLEALAGGVVVSSDVMTFHGTSPGLIVSQMLTVSGQFDTLRLVGAGPDNNGTDFFGIDNVAITLVPEPNASTLLGYGFAGLLGASIFRRALQSR